MEKNILIFLIYFFQIINENDNLIKSNNEIELNFKKRQKIVLNIVKFLKSEIKINNYKYKLSGIINNLFI